MLDAKTLLDRQYHEMRWRILSLAADFDRIQRAEGGDKILENDERLRLLRVCVDQLLKSESERAATIQMILSDRTPDPRKQEAGRR